MNNFEIVIFEYDSADAAEDGVNQFIGECDDNENEILEITSHIVAGEDNYFSYTFIFKLAI